MRPLVVALLVAGCGASDPCAGRSGTCIALTVQGSAARIDALAVTVAEPAPKTESTPTMAVALPVTLGLNLPASVQGLVHVGVVAMSKGVAVASASGQATVSHNRGSLTVTLTPPLGDMALVTTGDMTTTTTGADMASTDLAGTIAPPDLYSAPADFAGWTDLGCRSIAENCFNGIDDNCDGKVDCADPECGATTTCVPAVPNSWTYGALLSGTPACPQPGAVGTPLYNNFANGGTSCTGCSCGFSGTCSVKLYADSTDCSNMTLLTSEAPVATVTNACTAVNTSTRFQVAGPTFAGTCSNSGTLTLPPPSKTTDEFCPAPVISNGGCGAGFVCAPATGAAPRCVMAPGGNACPTGYVNLTSWFLSPDDQRSCGSCGCTVQDPTCFVQYYGVTRPPGSGTAVCPGAAYASGGPSDTQILCSATFNFVIDHLNTIAGTGGCGVGGSTVQGNYVGMAGTDKVVCCE